MNEQTSKERGPKGSGGAAPEAVAASHVALPCNCQHCGAIDKSQHSLVCPARLSDDYVQELRARAAAPIAPAAQEQRLEDLRTVHWNTVRYWEEECAAVACELGDANTVIEELVDALREATECVRKMLLAGAIEPAELNPQGWGIALDRAERKEGEAKHV